MMKKLLSIAFLLLFLTGCLYPEEKRVENQVPYKEQLISVQQAVLQYRLDKQTLPVRERENEENEFQKYLVDFQKLVPRYMQYPPGNSFENGGVYQYVLVNVEQAPEVKLIDLTMTKSIQEFQRTVNEYRRKNRFAPIKEILGNGVFLLDHEKLKLKEAPTVKSPYHIDHRLPLLMDEHGTIIVDYSLDLAFALEKFEHQFEDGDDIRQIFLDHFAFVPAYSPLFTLENGDIVISSNQN